MQKGVDRWTYKVDNTYIKSTTAQAKTMKTYKNKLTGQKLKTVKNDSQEMYGQMLSGILFQDVNTGEYKFMTNHQIEKMMIES